MLWGGFWRGVDVVCEESYVELGGISLFKQNEDLFFYLESRGVPCPGVMTAYALSLLVPLWVSAVLNPVM
jgi:hypothetical protein